MLPNQALVIDDNHMIRETMKVVVSMLGYRPLEAENGAKGLEVFKENESSIAFLVLDIEMPVMDGVTTLKELVQINPDVKVVMVTGNSEIELWNKVKAIKDVVILKKPFSIQQFSETVKDILN